MSDNQSQHSNDQPDRSLVPSDFSLRDIPFMLLAFIVISVASVILGLFVESFSSFWRGYLLGIVTTYFAMEILRQISRSKPDETEHQ